MLLFAGDERLSRQLRILVAAELFLHAEFYTRHHKIDNALNEKDCVFSRSSLENVCMPGDVNNSPNRPWNFKQAIMDESFETCNDGYWVGLIHIFAAASVLRREIWSSYQAGSKGIRPLLNGTIISRETTSAPKLVLLWSRDGALDQTQGVSFQPNYFVPLFSLDNDVFDDIPNDVFLSLDSIEETLNQQTTNKMESTTQVNYDDITQRSET